MSRNTVFIILFCMITLQAVLTYFQIKDYNNVVRRLKQHGEIGIGNIKGKISKGMIVLLCVKDDKVVHISSMKGMSVFARFKDIDDYNGMSIKELEDKALILSSSKENAIFYKALLLAIEMIRNPKNNKK